MKTIGMLGGMSWESTAVYYRLMNRAVQERLGGMHSAKTLMYSFDFGEIAVLQTADKWNEIADRLTTAATGLARAGADFLMICCNTQHLVAAEIERAVRLPLLHIADPLGEAHRGKRDRRAGLIGTCYTMEKGGVIADRLREKFGIDIVVPEAEDRAEVHRIIFEEMSRGQFLKFLARGARRGDGAAGRARCGRHHPRLHRTADAGAATGCERANLRYHHAARVGCGGHGARHSALQSGRL